MFTLRRSAMAALAFAPAIAQIQPNDGLVGGPDQVAAIYRLYLVPGLGSATPGAPTELGLSPALAARLNHFVIDQANAEIIATANPATAGGLTEVWRIRIQGTTVISETQLTTLPGTNNLAARAMHRDASGCILVLSRDNFLNGTFVVHRVAVTRQGALAVQIPVTVPANEVADAIATNPAGQILLGGHQPLVPLTPKVGVTMTVSQAGGLATVTATFNDQFVIAAATSSIGVPMLGLAPQILPPVANVACGGALSLYNYNPSPYVTLWNDIELSPDGTRYVLVGAGTATGGGVMARLGAVGCALGVQPAGTFFPHGLNQVAIAFASTRYGCGCPPSTDVLPQIGEIAPPTPGQPWRVTLTNGVPNSTAMLVAGRGDRFYLGAALPLPLSVFGGQPDCFLLNAAQFVYGLRVTNATGATTNSRALPNDPTLIGTKLYSQWMVYEVAPQPPFSTAAMISTVQ